LRGHFEGGQSEVQGDLAVADQRRATFKVIDILKSLADQYADAEHSIFGPSSSSRWLVCAGSLVPNALAPNDGNPDSAYGTVFHTVCETWLKTGKAPKHLIGTIQTVDGFEITIDDEMFDHARESVDRCILLPGDHIVERKVYFDRLTPIPKQGGTMDHAALRTHHATVTDHKGGMDRIHAYRNPQAMLYALGILYEFDWDYEFKSFTLRINQPRIGHYDEWECSRDELLEFAGYVKARAALAWRLNAPRTPDPKACQYCRVRGTCAANAQMQFKLMASETDIAFNDTPVEEIRDFVTSVEIGMFEPEAPPAVELTIEHLAALWPYRKMVEGWWKGVERELLERFKDGQQIPGLKVVEGRTHRAWGSEQGAIEALEWLDIPRSEVAPETLISPSEAEKVLLKHGYKRKELPELLGGLTRKPPGKPTLALAHDKRPALVDLTSIAFGDVAENQEDEGT
jgi:hypothetical protein